MLSDGDFNIPRDGSILDVRGIDLNQNVGNDNISQLGSSSRVVTAFSISFALHVIVVAAIVFWWLRLPDKSTVNMTHLFQVSINLAISNSAPSVSRQEVMETEIERVEMVKQASVEPKDFSVSDNKREEELRREPDTNATLEKNESEAAMEVIDQDKTLVSDNSRDSRIPNQITSVEPVSDVALQISGDIKTEDIISAVPKSVPIDASERKMIEQKLAGFIAEIKNENPISNSFRWQENGVSYQADINKRDVVDVMALEALDVDLTRIKDEKENFTQLQYKRLAFSNFAQIVNRWDDDVYISEDVFEGRFHSNSSINIDSGRKFESIFLGKVTIASFRDPPRKYRRSEIFKAGLELGVEKIKLPKGVSPLNEELFPSEEQVHYFSEDTSIRFMSDGSYQWSVGETNDWTHSRSIHPDTSYLLAEKGIKLNVQGVLSGKVIVYSPERITIVGNVIYSQDPRSNPASNDYLGLVSEKNVEIAGPKIIGESDLEIHAAIYAKRRFSVRRYRVRTNAMMTILGSVSAGSLSATEPRYATQIRFDKRLENKRPPLFPVTDQYEVSDWNAVWQ